jgi:hypothetical protein
MNPKYPIYIISKGRADTRLTSKALEKMNVPYRIVIEPQELRRYSEVIDSSKILVLPFSNLGQGGVPARNWVWEHSCSEGHKRHWILDDNIAGFRSLISKKRIPMMDGEPFIMIESFVDRFANVPMAGMQYTGFMVSESSTAKGAARMPMTMNTRVYSCMLLCNKTKGFRWRGRYNEDTDLSIRFLKAGYCTMLFNKYMCDKQATMTMTGGNSEELYKQDDKFDGRLEMAKHLKRQHPDVTKIVWRWGRWQHSCNFNRFKKNQLLKRRNP